MPTRILIAGVPDVLVDIEPDEVAHYLADSATAFHAFQASGDGHRLLIRSDAVVRLEAVPEAVGEAAVTEAFH